MGKLIYIILYVIVLVNSLQLLMTASSFPLPAGDNNNGSSADDSAATNVCRCNGTKLAIKGNFLSKWLNPSNGESRISMISMAANYLKMLTDNKEVRQYTNDHWLYYKQGSYVTAAIHVMLYSYSLPYSPVTTSFYCYSYVYLPCIYSNVYSTAIAG